ncbi:hypothetical protein GCM10009551_033370 [Nocardiopsis tropica]|uniref:protein kinase domain-containing protein n=1 Tax=Nocardiopsis tropica TaxID=109330 RepID=UPI0031D621A7
MADPLRDSDPAHIGPYTLHARLGGGGMGQVFLGRSPGGHTVAVKVVRPELADDADFRRRFAAEVKAARKVGGFYTAPVVDADTDATPPWLATAYIPGPTLYRAVTDHGPLPAETVAVLGAGLAEGLAAVHAQQIVHRDLKPANVLLTAEGPRLIDFGIARALDTTSHTHSSTVVGTAAFMSPEQAKAQKVGPASDVFSLGCVLAFAATARSPFGEGPALAVLFRVVQEEPDLAGLPVPLAGLISACLAKDSAARPGLDDVLTALTAIASTRARDGGRWLPDDLTEALARHTLAYTRIETPQARPPARKTAEPKKKRSRASEPGTAAPDRAALVVGNLSLEPLEVLLDGIAVGAVPGGGHSRFPLEAGQHTVQVDAGGRRSTVRRIEFKPRGTVRKAFDIGTGSNARPEPVEEVEFKGSWGVPEVLGTIFLLASIVLLGGLISSIASLIDPLLGQLCIAAGFILAVWWVVSAIAEGSPHLGLRDSGLTAGTERGPGKRMASWQDLTQVSLVGEGVETQFVIWPGKDLPKFASLKDFQGGKVVCLAKEIGAAKHQDIERLRAALRWFADDRWVEQTAGRQGGR